MILPQRVILDTYTLRQALAALNDVGELYNVLFIVNEDFSELLATLSDGDIRRGFVKRF